MKGAGGTGLAAMATSAATGPHSGLALAHAAAAAAAGAAREGHHHHHHHGGGGGTDGVNSAAAAAAAGSEVGRGAASVPARVSTPPLGVSASVGHDHWASDVLSAVKGGAEEPPPPPPPAPARPRSESPPPRAASPSDPVARLVLERKKRFHSGRMLEVKNLPDECTEQVGSNEFPTFSCFCFLFVSCWRGGATFSLATSPFGPSHFLLLTLRVNGFFSPLLFLSPPPPRPPPSLTPNLQFSHPWRGFLLHAYFPSPLTCSSGEGVVSHDDEEGRRP